MKKIKFYSGISFVELLTVISIITIMTGVTVASMVNIRSKNNLTASQREIASAIKIAQANALQGKTQRNGSKDETPCGYGFRFTSNNTYKIFYNFHTVGQNCDEQNKQADYLHYRNSPSAEAGTLIDKTKVTNNLGDTEIYFTVPHGKTYDQNGNAFSAKNITIDFAGLQSTIRINSKGVVTEL